MKEIKAGIKDGSYASLHAFEADVRLMFRNAHTYNAPGSLVYNDAEAMQAAFQVALCEINDKARLTERNRLAGAAARMQAEAAALQVSTRILGRRTAPFPPFLIPCRVPHGFTPRS